MGNMQFNGLAFRYNPRRLELGCEKTVKVIEMPFSPPVLQELGVRPRVLRGEGEFFGPDCGAQFERLWAEFLRGGAGRLFCPLCPPMSAYFTALRVIGEAGPPLLRYSFEFVEEISPAYSGAAGAVVNGRAVFS